MNVKTSTQAEYQEIDPGAEDVSARTWTQYSPPGSSSQFASPPHDLSIYSDGMQHDVNYRVATRPDGRPPILDSRSWVTEASAEGSGKHPLRSQKRSPKQLGLPPHPPNPTQVLSSPVSEELV